MSFAKAFEVGVREALKVFQNPMTREALAKGAQRVLRDMAKAVKVASKLKPR